MQATTLGLYPQSPSVSLSLDFRYGLPLEMLYADDLVLIAESLEKLKEKFELWRSGMNSKKD